MKLIIVAALTVSVFLASSSARCVIPSLIGTLAYDLASTVRVVNNLCNSGKDKITDELATKFFDCYDAAPAGGREIYTNCQIKVNGVDGVMNTTAGIQKTCGNIITFPKYAKCLADDFKKAGIKMSDAVTNVNLCEEQVLGLGRFSG